MAESKSRVLIVDPDPASLTTLSQRLEALGNQVATAANGDEGLARFWEFLPDLTFVDVLALGEAGDRMVGELKRTDYGVIQPIVVHSLRHPSLNRVEVMRRYGAVDYIYKPIQESKVRALVEWVQAPRGDSSQAIAHELLDRFSLSADSEGVVSLESGSLPYLLGRAEEERLSGLLLMIAGSFKNILVFEQGLIVGASSNAPAEQIERVLLSMRKLTPAWLADVKSKAQSGQELLPLLSFLGILHGDERKEVLRYQALTIGLSMFRLMTGWLQFRHGESIECARLEPGIRPTTLALIGLRKNATLLRTATERFVRDPVVFNPPAAAARQGLRTLPLSKFERTVLASVDGARSVKDLRELGRLVQIDLDEPLAVLVGSGILKPSSTQPAAGASATAERVEAAAPAAPMPASTGSLDHCPFLDLVGSLLREGANGLLTVEGVAYRSFAFADREIVYARSSQPEDSLGRLLVATRVIGRDALDRALTLQRQVPDRRLGSLLVEMHALTPDALYRGLRSQILRILEDTFTWQVGMYSFVPGAPPPEWSVRLDAEPTGLLRQGTLRLSHKQLRTRWSRAGARLVADRQRTDTAMLTSAEIDLLAEAGQDGGVELTSRDIGGLRRAHLLVVAGYAHVVGGGDPQPAAEESDTAAPPAMVRSAPVSAPAPYVPPPPMRRSASDPLTPADVRVDFDTPADIVLPDRTTGETTRAILAFLKEELVSEKRALDVRLRQAEIDLRHAMQEIGRLGERARHLEDENRTLRERVAEPARPDAARTDAARTDAARTTPSASEPRDSGEGSMRSLEEAVAGAAAGPVTPRPEPAAPDRTASGAAKTARPRARSAKRKTVAARKAPAMLPAGPLPGEAQAAGERAADAAVRRAGEDVAADSVPEGSGEAARVAAAVSAGSGKGAPDGAAARAPIAAPSSATWIAARARPGSR